MKRDSIIFYRSFYEAIKELPADMQAAVYNAIFEYSLNFNQVELQGLPKTIFTLIKPQLDANNKRFENGSKGGRKKASDLENESKEEPKQNQNETKGEANNNNNNNNNNNYNVKEKKIKVIDLEVRKKNFSSTLSPYLEKYGKEMLNAFYKYWTEENKSKTKLRFEDEKFWNLAKRLSFWHNNEKMPKLPLGQNEAGYKPPPPPATLKYPKNNQQQFKN